MQNRMRIRHLIGPVCRFIHTETCTQTRFKMNPATMHLGVRNLTRHAIPRQNEMYVNICIHTCEINEQDYWRGRGRTWNRAVPTRRIVAGRVLPTLRHNRPLRHSTNNLSALAFQLLLSPEVA